MVIAIVAGALAFVLLAAGVVVGAVALGNAVSRAVAHRGGTTHPEGNGARTGTHRAPAPLHCSDTCITSGAAQAVLRPSAGALSALGTPDLSDDGGDAKPSDPRSDYEDAMDAWQGGDPIGDDCMFSYGVSPVSAAEGHPPRDDRSTSLFLAEHQSEDGGTVLDQAIRVFSRSDDAEGYVAQLQDRIAGCRHYATAGENDVAWDADVSAIAQWPSLPKDVSAIGWTEEDAHGGVFFGVDLQRGDLVLRTTVLGDLTGADQIRAFVAATAQQLERIPSDGSAPPNA